MERQRVAKTLVVLDEDMGLLLRRSPTDSHRPGEFDLPGGEVEYREPLKAGAAREVYEETGLFFRSSQMNLRWLGESVKMREEGLRLVVRRLFVAQLALTEDVNIVLCPTEHDHFEILPLKDIADRLNHPEWSRGIRKVLADSMVANSTYKKTSVAS